MLVLELLPCILFISTIGYILNDEESLLILHWCGIYMDSTTNVNKPISSSKKFVLQLWTCSACLWNFSMFIHYRIRLQAFFFFYKLEKTLQITSFLVKLEKSSITSFLEKLEKPSLHMTVETKPSRRTP